MPIEHLFDYHPKRGGNNPHHDEVSAQLLNFKNGICIESGHRLFAVLPQTPENRLGLRCAGPQLLVDQKGATPIRSKDDYRLLNI